MSDPASRALARRSSRQRFEYSFTITLADRWLPSRWRNPRAPVPKAVAVEHQQRSAQALPGPPPKSPIELLRLARLRGVSAFIVGPASEVCWRGEIVPPTKATQRDAAQTLVPVQQTGRKCDLARVLPRMAMSAPDVVGTTLLRNLSPISGTAEQGDAARWHVQIRTPAVGSLNKLKDIQIDLLCAGTSLEG